MYKRRVIVGDGGIGELAKPDELLTGTVEAVVVSGEAKSRQEVTNLIDMVRVFRADDKVKIHEPDRAATSSLTSMFGKRSWTSGRRPAVRCRSTSS